jgi:bifunctional non-homologous end joining protein LigD
MPGTLKWRIEAIRSTYRERCNVVNTMSGRPLVPVRLVLRKEPFDDPAWSFEIKYDGFRGLLILEGARSRFISRTMKHLPRFDALAVRIAGEVKVRNAILDGEIAAVDDEGRPIFTDLLRDARRPAYIAFDLLSVDGADLRELPLSKRRTLLRRLVPKRSRNILQAGWIDGKGRAFFELIRTQDLEGIVAKRRDQPYRTSVRWYKIKNGTYTQGVGRDRFFVKRPKRRA